jgi:hypothetical protein
MEKTLVRRRLTRRTMVETAKDQKTSSRAPAGDVHNKLVCNQSIKYFTIPRTNHYSNLDIDIIDHGKTIGCTTHHVGKRLQ